MMRKPGPQQKKIIIIAAVIVLFIVLTWVFIYIPQKKKLRDLKSELERTEDEIAEINKLAQGKDIIEIATKLHQQLNNLVANLGQGEDEVLDFLAQDARERNIEVKNKTFSDRLPVEHTVAGYKIEALPISVHLSCDLRSLGEHLEFLRNNRKVLTKLERLQIKGNGEGNQKLDVDMQIKVYVGKDIK